MLVEDLGLLPYRQAWEYQERVHEQVLAGGAERLLLVEHPPVITFGRRPGIERNLIASAQRLAELGVEVVPSDRGGDITFHGPGQLVAYPIIRLADHSLSINGYVHKLEDIIIATIGNWGIAAHKDPCAIGVWTGDAASAAKIAAIGVRIRRGITLHGLALNVNVDLRFFDLIVPCGLTGRAVTSMERLLGERCPKMDEVKAALVKQAMDLLAQRGTPSSTSCTPT